MECAVALYPPASQDVNPGFFKTLQQALSKHFAVTQQSQVHLIAPTKQVEGILAKPYLTSFKDMLVECLTTIPCGRADLEMIKQLLFTRHKRAVFNDVDHQTYDEFVATEAGTQEMKKMEVRIAKMLKRSDQTFFKSPKVYGLRNAINNDQS